MTFLLSGCLFSLDAGDPMAGLSCDEKLERMKSDLGKVGADSAPAFVPQWIPPYGYPNEALLPDTGNTDTDTTRPVPIPPGISLLQVITSGAFRADIRIYDYKGDRMAAFTETFGYHGELKNPNRIVPRGMVAFLPWNARDMHGKPVQTANYLWEVTFRFANRRVETQKTKISFWGSDCSSE